MTAWFLFQMGFPRHFFRCTLHILFPISIDCFLPKGLVHRKIRYQILMQRIFSECLYISRHEKNYWKWVTIRCVASTLMYSVHTIEEYFLWNKLAYILFKNKSFPGRNNFKLMSRIFTIIVDVCSLKPNLY